MDTRQVKGFIGKSYDLACLSYTSTFKILLKHAFRDNLRIIKRYLSKNFKTHQ